MCVCLSAQGNILEDIELIENLEETKRTAVEIEEKVAQAKVTEVSISAAREVYRPVAARGSQVYFLIDNLNALDGCATLSIRGVAHCSANTGRGCAPVQQTQLSCVHSVNVCGVCGATIASWVHMPN